MTLKERETNHKSIFANFSVDNQCSDDKNLAQYLEREDGRLKEDKVIILIGQLLKEYKLLYNKKIRHGNIQPKTLIMKGEILKLDLLARPSEFKSKIRESKLQDFSIDKNYIAPESLSTEKYNTKADIWSIGAITYYMLHGKPPLDVDIRNAYQKEYVVDESLSQLCMDFLSCCLQGDPKKRMNFEKIKSHPFVTRAMEDWKLVDPNPYFKSRFLVFGEYKCNINELIRGIIKAKDEISVVEIADLTETLSTQNDKSNLSNIKKKEKDVKFGTYC